MMKCPGFERLIDYLDGRLSAEEAGPVDTHLSSGCTKCAADRLWYERLRAVAAADDSVEPPSWVVKRAIRLFENRPGRESATSRLVGAIASLVFDSFARPALAGVRSTETTNRQLLYSADPYSVDLQITASDQPRTDLVGQVLHKEDTSFESVAGLPLHLIREGETLRSTATNRNGEFVIEAVDFGEYDLRIVAPDLEIIVPAIPVEPSL
jgi:hypothetical protein